MCFPRTAEKIPCAEDTNPQRMVNCPLSCAHLKGLVAQEAHKGRPVAAGVEGVQGPPAIGALTFSFFGGGEPPKKRLHQKGYSYSNLSTGGPSVILPGLHRGPYISLFGGVKHQ